MLLLSAWHILIFRSVTILLSRTALYNSTDRKKSQGYSFSSDQEYHFVANFSIAPTDFTVVPIMAWPECACASLFSDETIPEDVFRKGTQCTPEKIRHSAHMSRLELDQCKKHWKHEKGQYQILNINPFTPQISINRPTLLVYEDTVSGYKDFCK